MIGVVRVALISGTKEGFGIQLALQDCEVIERDESLMPYVDMTTTEALPIMDALIGMLIQAICRNAK